MLKGFRDFILRGNVVDLAVAVVIGAAFTAVVNAVVKGLITPLVAAIVGKPSFDELTFTINDANFLYGSVLNELITFVSIAAVVYFFVVQPMNIVQERLKPGKPVDVADARVPRVHLGHPARGVALRLLHRAGHAGRLSRRAATNSISSAKPTSSVRSSSALASATPAATPAIASAPISSPSRQRTLP